MVRVTTASNRPLSEVKVAYSERPDIILGKTDSSGRLNIANVCSEPQAMIVSKPLYVTKEATTTTVDARTSTLNVILEESSK